RSGSRGCWRRSRSIRGCASTSGTSAARWRRWESRSLGPTERSIASTCIRSISSESSFISPAGRCAIEGPPLHASRTTLGIAVIASSPAASALLVAALFLSPSRLEAETDAPARAVRETLDAAERTVESPGSRDEKLARLDEIARTLIDTEGMAENALGDVLAVQPPEARQAFIGLYEEYVVRAYLQKLLLFRNARFAVAPAEQRAGETLVRTRIRTERDEYRVDYALHETGGRWRAVDIVVEGVSLCRNHGEQVRSLLSRESFEELLERIQRKVEWQRLHEAGS